MSRWFACLSHEQVVATWPRLRELLDPACAKSGGEIEAPDICEMSAAGEAFIAVGGDGGEITAALAMSVVTKPRIHTLNVFAIGGANVRAFLRDALPNIIDFARDIGASYLQANCGTAEARLFRRACALAGHQTGVAYTTYKLEI